MVYKKDLIYKGFGLISREEVSVTLRANQENQLRFITKNGNIIPISTDSLFSTQRNTVLASGDDAVCLVEHFLAAAAFARLRSFDIVLSHEELPFEDGSAKFWLNVFDSWGLIQEAREPFLVLPARIQIQDEEDPTRYILMEPSEHLSLTYHLDWAHPLIGIQEYTWTTQMNVLDLLSARTFSSEYENQILGLSGIVIGLTETGFTKELHSFDEPCRHKLLDLIGDLMLSTYNPLDIKMKVYSHKAGHALNAKAAQQLKELLARKETELHVN